MIGHRARAAREAHRRRALDKLNDAYSAERRQRNKDLSMFLLRQRVKISRRLFGQPGRPQVEDEWDDEPRLPISLYPEVYSLEVRR